MPATRAFETTEFHPAYGIIVLADTNQDWDPDEDPQVPHHRDRGDRPTGTFAGSGAGWITAQAPGLYGNTVRIELHDTAPAADHADFDDVMEAPFRSSSGELTLTDLTGGYGTADLELSDPEWFRVRIARRRVDDSDLHWLIRFWPEQVRELPVWFARGPEPHGGPAAVADDIAAMLRWTPGLPWETSVDELAGRLLVSADAVREALTCGVVQVVGDDPLRLALDHGSPGHRS